MLRLESFKGTSFAHTQSVSNVVVVVLFPFNVTAWKAPHPDSVVTYTHLFFFFFARSFRMTWNSCDHYDEEISQSVPYIMIS